MISFKTIRARNFMSIGASPIEYTLDEYPTTLIVGKNGAGKSLLIEMLTFALYGKSYRNITKGQLVNSINNTESLVELTFETKGKTYRIVRGQKPNVFDVFENEEKLDVGSSVRELQSYLEDNILKMNERSFRQIVVIGSGNYVPFMELTTSQRRVVIEDILGIDIFTKMGTLLKDEEKRLKKNLQELQSKQQELLGNKRLIEKYQSEVEANNEERIQDIEKNIKELDERQNQLREDMLELKQTILDEWARLDGRKEVEDELSLSKMTMMSNGRKIVELRSSIDFMEGNATCPSCKQEIGEQHRKTIVESLEKNISEFDEENTDLDKKIVSLKKKVSEYSAIEQQATQMKSNGSKMNATRKEVLQQIETLKAQIEKIKMSSEKSSIVGDMEEIEKSLADLAEEFSEKNRTKDIHNISFDILADGGIKQQIVKRYIPFINEQVNKYLDIFNLPVKFIIDEDFNERILSRYRDSFTFNSFSEGQRSRIDLAMLLSWRAVSSLRNSQTCNILVLDEVFDGSLDADGVSDLTNILHNLSSDGTNVFVISHRDASFFDKFSRTFEVKLAGQFTKIKEV